MNSLTHPPLKEPTFVVEQGLECAVLTEVKPNNGEHWLVLHMPNGQQIQVRLGNCRQISVKMRGNGI